MSTVATLWVKLALDSSAYTTGLASAVSRTKSMGASMLGAGKTLTVGLTLPILAAGAGALKAATDFEKTNIAFTTMLGSADEAKSLLADLASFAAKTPFLLPEVEKGAKALMAYGISTEDILPALKSLGDVAAGLDVPLSRLILNYGQVKTQTKLTGRELRDFAVLGVPLIAELAKNLGVSESAISEMVSKGEIGFPEVESAFVSMTSSGGKFEDLMDALSKTTAGQFANLIDVVILLAREIGKNLLPMANNLIAVAFDWVAAFKALSPGTQRIIMLFLGLVAIVGPLLLIFGMFLTAVAAIVTFFAGPAAAAIGTFIVGTLLPFVLPILAIIAAVVLLAIAWKNNWGGIQDKIKAVVGFISGLLTAFWNRIKGVFEAGMAIVKMIFSAWSSAFSGDWTAFGEKVRKVWEMAWELIKRIFKSAGTFLLTTAKNIVVSIVGFFKNTNWKQVGINIVKGIGAGLKSMMSWIGNTARSVAKAAFDAAKGFLGIQSPSKLFGELGKFSAMGFGEGFKGTMGKLQPAMNVSMVGGIPAVPGTAGQDMFGQSGQLDVKQLAREIRDVFLREQR